jgi:hypothetical protein
LNPARFVYGTVTVGALLAAESAQRETYLETVAAVLLALLMFWLAHTYAEFTARRLTGTERLTISALSRALTHESPILLGAAGPLLAVLASWLVGAPLTSAVTAAIWAAVAMTLLIEVIAALRARRTGFDLVLETGIGLVLGGIVIAIKLVLH